jgi:hypothetical protein
MEKLNIKQGDYNILKAYIQAQLLLETLDTVEDESKMNIKHSTKKYKKSLEKKVEQVIDSTYSSNPKLFSEIMLDMKDYLNCLDSYFIIQK